MPFVRHLYHIPTRCFNILDYFEDLMGKRDGFPVTMGVLPGVNVNQKLNPVSSTLAKTNPMPLV